MKLCLLIIFMAVIAVVDMASTLYWLSIGAATEANPIMAWLLAHGAHVAVLVKGGTIMAWAAVLLVYSRQRYSFCCKAAWLTVVAYVSLWMIGVFL